jgi:phosphoenolpyruvate carboxykinase (GTP)
VEGQLRYDPMSMRPFMSYAEGDYAAHWLKIVGQARELPIFAHVNWFQRDPDDGHFLWPGYQENLRPLLWLLQLKHGEVEGRPTPVGILPTEEELNLEGVDISRKDLDRILSIDVERWRQEVDHREEHLSKFERLPEEIWEAHRRIDAALRDASG